MFNMRKLSLIVTLSMVAVLLLTACTVQLIDPSTATEPTAQENTLFNLPPVEISAEVPYETQFVEVNGSQMAYRPLGRAHRPI